MPQAPGEFRGLLPSASREGPGWIRRLLGGNSWSRKFGGSDYDLTAGPSPYTTYGDVAQLVRAADC